MAALSKRSGCEGPRHDPYHFDEYTFTRTDGLRITLHMGLSCYVKMQEVIDGRCIRYANPDLDEEDIPAFWERATKLPVGQLERIYNRLHPYIEDGYGCLGDYE